MTMVKKTVTLDAEAVAGADELGNGNFSAYVNEALLDRIRRDRLRRLAASDAAERGAVSKLAVEDTLASVDAASAS